MKNHSILAKTLLFLAAVSLIVIAFGCDWSNIDCPALTGSGSNYDTYSPGPYSVEVDLSAGPSGDSGLFYPSTGAGPFPILVFGCGAGSNPPDYEDHGKYIASWGFVVVIETSTGTGQELIDAIDWLEDVNAGSGSNGGGFGCRGNNNNYAALKGRIDTTKIAAGGHSLGSMGTFEIADDPRLTTTIHVAGGAGGTTARILEKPSAFICGEDDAMGTRNANTDYGAVRSGVPVFMTVMKGVDHICATRSGLPAICAWLLWQLKGETQRQGDFLNSNGEFQVNEWDSKDKNF